MPDVCDTSTRARFLSDFAKKIRSPRTVSEEIIVVFFFFFLLQRYRRVRELAQNAGTNFLLKCTQTGKVILRDGKIKNFLREKRKLYAETTFTHDLKTGIKELSRITQYFHVNRVHADGVIFFLPVNVTLIIRSDNDLSVIFGEKNCP